MVSKRRKKAGETGEAEMIERGQMDRVNAGWEEDWEMELEVGIELRNKIQESENKKTVSFLKRRD